MDHVTWKAVPDALIPLLQQEVCRHHCILGVDTASDRCIDTMGGMRFIQDSDDDDHDDEDSETEASSRIPLVTTGSITIDIESLPPVKASGTSNHPSTGSTGMPGTLRY